MRIPGQLGRETEVESCGRRAASHRQPSRIQTDAGKYSPLPQKESTGKPCSNGSVRQRTLPQGYLREKTRKEGKRGFGNPELLLRFTRAQWMIGR
jgi:hypothetical protein